MTLLEHERGLREHVLHYLAAQVHDTQPGAGRGRGGLGGQPRSPLAAGGDPVRGQAAHATARRAAGIAEELGISRVTVNRALQELVRLGAIRIEPRAVTLLDLSQLDAATQDHVAMPASQAGATPGQST